MEQPGWVKVLAQGPRLLRSPWLAAVLLIEFLLACLIGNLVPHRVNDGFRIFQTPWFLFLTALLALSTLVCTWEQLTRARQAQRRARQGGPVVLPRTARAVTLSRPPEEAAQVVESLLRRLGLRVRRDGAFLRGENTLGRWGSPLFHLGLVLVFVTVVVGALVQWSTAVILSEGGTYDPAAEPPHGATRSAWSPAPAPERLPVLTLVTHFPRYQMKGYAPDAASEVQVNGVRRLLRFGTPLAVRGLTLRQNRQYGVVAEVVLRPGGKAETASPTSAKAPPAGPPPAFGGPYPLPDGTYRGGLVFVNQANAEQQRRQLELPPVRATGTFRLLPGPEAARLELPLARRFRLAVAVSPDGPAGVAPVRETLVSVGQSLPLGSWKLEFRSLRYWTTFTLTAAPLTPLLFALFWWCAAALGLGLLFPERRVELALSPADGEDGGSGTILRYQTFAGRGAAGFPKRVDEALAQLEEEEP